MKDYAEVRGCGLTTGLALSSIAEAIKNPGTRVYVCDHFEPDTNRSANRLTIKIKELIDKLRLEDIEVWVEDKNVIIQSNYYGYVVGVENGEIFKIKLSGEPKR